MITFLRELSPLDGMKTSNQALLRKEKSTEIKVEIGIISPLDYTAKLSVKSGLLVQHNAGQLGIIRPDLAQLHPRAMKCKGYLEVVLIY